MRKFGDPDDSREPSLAPIPAKQTCSRRFDARVEAIELILCRTEKSASAAKLRLTFYSRGRLRSPVFLTILEQFRHEF
jgi:hypothetical protein